MGYLDTLVSTAVTVTPDGRMAFYPWGSFGGGYEIETAEDRRAARRTVVCQIALLPASLFSIALLGWYALLAIPVILTAGALIIRNLTRRLKTSDATPVADHGLEVQVQFLGPFVLWLMLAFALFMALWGVLQFFNGDDTLSAAGLVALGSFGVYSVVRMLRVHARLKPGDSADGLRDRD